MATHIGLDSNATEFILKECIETNGYESFTPGIVADLLASKERSLREFAMTLIEHIDPVLGPELPPTINSQRKR